ncbi:MAG: hypothetical protein ACXVCY_01130 [Pseudobdellovibrionaceae bacterium]
MSNANISHICDSDQKKPIAIIIATIQIKDFEFSQGQEAIEEYSDINMSDDSNEWNGTIYVLPKDKELEHYLRFTSHYNAATITYSRQPNFAGMIEHESKYMILPFLMKSGQIFDNPLQKVAFTDYKIIHKGKTVLSDSDYRRVIKNQAYIVNLLKDGIEKPSKYQRMDVIPVSADEEGCKLDVRLCTGRFSLGVAVKISF